MKTLSGENLRLRALEPEDLEFLYLLENEESVWEVSHTVTPYSKYVLRQYLENAHRDIYEVKQLRLAICRVEGNEVIGFIDLFDFDPIHKRAGMGIVIFSEDDRRKGYASEAIKLLRSYCFSRLGLHQVYAHIGEDNEPSRALFDQLGFEQTGLRKDWISSAGTFKNELLYQYFNEKA